MNHQTFRALVIGVCAACSGLHVGFGDATMAALHGGVAVWFFVRFAIAEALRLDDQ